MSAYEGVQKAPGGVAGEGKVAQLERQGSRGQMQPQIGTGRGIEQAPNALFCLAADSLLAGLRLSVHPD